MRTMMRWLGVIAVVACAAWAIGVRGESSATGAERQGGAKTARHELPPRKAIIGTTMTRWYSDYPGLEARIKQMTDLVDEMAAESKAKYGRSIDLALFTEYALTAGKTGSAAEVAVAWDEKVIPAFAAKAREHNTYIVLGGVFLDDAATGACSNAAVILDRQGKPMGRYVKVHPVYDEVRADGKIILEGGVSAGKEYNVFDFDFGRVGVQICYDVEFPEGWQRLAEKGVDLVLFPTQSPQTVRPGMYANHHQYWIVSSTFRTNATVFEPGTGLIAAQITEPRRTLVHEIDLSYLVLPWSPTLRHGDAFREKYGDKVGFNYSMSEDRGVFWSNDEKKSIGEMARELGLAETADELEVARKAQDELRGGPAR